MLLRISLLTGMLMLTIAHAGEAAPNRGELGKYYGWVQSAHSNHMTCAEVTPSFPHFFISNTDDQICRNLLGVQFAWFSDSQRGVSCGESTPAPEWKFVSWVNPDCCYDPNAERCPTVQ